MKDQIQGKAEELKGKITGDRGEEMKGKVRQDVGKVKEKVRDVREDVSNKVEEDRMRHDPEREPGPEGDPSSR